MASATLPAPAPADATHVRPATACDAGAVVDLLRAAHLPVAFDPAQTTVVQREDRVVACARLKPLGDGSAELAGVVVAADLRGHGLGERVVAEALRRAPALTYALALAPGFFERQGFRRLPDVPAPLRAKAATACDSQPFVPMVRGA